VLDGSGKPIQGLSKEQVTVTENGQKVSIDSLQPAGLRDPLSLAIVLDRSESMTGEKIERAKESVLRFITLMEPGDRAALFSFSDKVEVLEPLTDNLDLLRRDVMNIQPGGHTAFFDAIARGVESLSGVSGRKAVIVLTDGIANRGALDLEQAVEIAAKAYVSVTVIGLGKDVRTARLEGIAKDTGGTYFYAPQAAGLADIYSTISNRIHNEYVITFHTQKRADYLRNVTMALATGERTVRAYFQPQSSLFGAGAKPPVWAFAIPLMSILGFVILSLRKIEQQYQTGHLSVVRGKGTKKDLDIGATVTIGRDEQNTLGLFKDQDISQQHAEVTLVDGRYVIEDKGSETGTLVNKKPVTKRQVLEDGDVINVGNSTIVFSEQSSRTCTGCGSTLRAGAKFCGKCGEKLEVRSKR
jgi:VWFA-related protein